MSSNMNNINYNDFKNICRMCMLNCDLKFILDCVVSNIFRKLTDLQLDANDHLPKQICLKCFEKIIEIQEFEFQCKRTHSALMECLNKQPNVVQNEGIEKQYEIIIALDKIVTTDVETNSLNSTDNNQMKIIKETNDGLNDDTIQETCQIKEEVDNTDLEKICYNFEEEITIEEHKIEFVKDEYFTDEKTEIYNDQSINCSEVDLLISNTSNISVENVKTSNDNPILNDLNGDTISSTCGKPLNMNSSELNRMVYKCLQCSKSFTRSDNMKKHMRAHSGDRPFKCKQCSKSFTHSCHLKAHMRAHSGERPFKCEECSKSFTQAYHLKVHMRVHSGERPFKCNQCSKSFPQSCSLTSHMRTHTGERPFQCKECSKSFAHSFNLKRHMGTHSDKRPYRCSQCSKSFNCSSSLQLHMLTHSGDRPFKCSQCSKSFSQLGNLKRHLLTVRCLT